MEDEWARAESGSPEDGGSAFRLPVDELVDLSMVAVGKGRSETRWKQQRDGSFVVLCLDPYRTPDGAVMGFQLEKGQLLIRSRAIIAETRQRWVRRERGGTKWNNGASSDRQDYPCTEPFLAILEMSRPVTVCCTSDGILFPRGRGVVDGRRRERKGKVHEVRLSRS